MSPTRTLLRCALAGLVSCTLGVLAARADPAPAAAPKAHHRLHHRHAAAPAASQASLHMPRPAAAPPAEGAAPVPNEDIVAPPDRQAPEANVEPSIFHLHYPITGEGYVAGSSPSTIDNEHAGRIGGVQLQVPLK